MYFLLIKDNNWTNEGVACRRYVFRRLGIIKKEKKERRENTHDDSATDESIWLRLSVFELEDGIKSVRAF